MQIVIDIPERRYRLLQKQAKTNLGKEKIDEFAEAVLNGTPLPKGHGRLIDVDKLEPRDISPEAWYSPMLGFELFDIEDAPTIIEADTESEDKE